MPILPFLFPATITALNLKRLPPPVTLTTLAKSKSFDSNSSFGTARPTPALPNPGLLDGLFCPWPKPRGAAVSPPVGIGLNPSSFFISSTIIFVIFKILVRPPWLLGLMLLFFHEKQSQICQKQFYQFFSQRLSLRPFFQLPLQFRISPCSCQFLHLYL